MTLRQYVAFGSLACVVPVLASCGSRGAPDDVRAVTGTPTGASAEAGEAYDLYTHCGIEWAKIHGVMWRTRPALSDGSGNPPAGWGNPSQAGTVSFVGDDTAVFTSSAGTVTFHRTARTEPPFLCD